MRNGGNFVKKRKTIALKKKIDYTLVDLNHRGRLWNGNKTAN